MSTSSSNNNSGSGSTSGGSGIDLDAPTTQDIQLLTDVLAMQTEYHIKLFKDLTFQLKIQNQILAQHFGFCWDDIVQMVTSSDEKSTGGEA